MENAIDNYIIIPDFEQVPPQEVADLIQQIKRGRVDEDGYCRLSAFGGGGYFDRDIILDPIRIIGYDDGYISGKGETNPSASSWFNARKLNFQKLTDGESSSMVVHYHIADENPDIAGLEGLMIPKALLVRRVHE